ncbi:MAG: response regulator [Cyanobacteriota bacterium]|nr:response regulator [Cyanobacteriota bacterium]
MQGTLNEIDIRSILQLIELGQRTGELFVEAYSGGGTFDLSDERDTAPDVPADERFWLLFFINGQIAYAADHSNRNLSRLREYLHRHKAESALSQMAQAPMSSMNPLEYAYLWLLMENRVLTPAQGRNIIESTIKETLFDLFNLRSGTFNFEMGPALAPQLTALELAPLAASIAQQVQQWKQFYPHIQSLNQCPILTDRPQLQHVLSSSAFASLESWSNGKTSLRQFSRYFNRDPLAIAKAIYPYVQQGWIQMLEGSPSGASVSPDGNSALSAPLKPNSPPKIVCIDDDISLGKTVEYILEPEGYRAIAIAEPLKALAQVFQIRPDLILCDIAMPDLDGYEICAMLRSSRTFHPTPIIMLTGKEGFIDRIKARKVGATDYLTKPFGESELLMLVEKHIGSPATTALDSGISSD